MKALLLLNYDKYGNSLCTMVRILILDEVERRYDDCYVKGKLYRKTQYTPSSAYTLVITSSTTRICHRMVGTQCNETR